eukprot:ANDGO_07962.mRNA.1 Axin interactor
MANAVFVAELKPVLARVESFFSQGIEHDSWGQAVEAADSYTRVAAILEKEHPNLKLSQALIQAFYTVFSALKCRVAMLRATRVSSNSFAPSKDDMRTVYEFLMTCLKTGVAPSVPIDVKLCDPNEEFKRVFFHSSSAATVILEPGKATAPMSTNSSLLPPPLPQRDASFVTVHVSRVGLKDAMRYVDPFITATVIDAAGTPLEPPQDSPCSRRLKPLYVDFGIDIHVQTPLELLPPGAAIVLEFKHFKAEKHKLSTRCFTVLDSSYFDKIESMHRQGNKNVWSREAKVPLYKKPTDWTRKKLVPFTAKPLFMEVIVSVRGDS